MSGRNIKSHFRSAVCVFQVSGEIADYEVVLVLDILDIDGNGISFAEEL